MDLFFSSFPFQRCVLEEKLFLLTKVGRPLVSLLEENQATFRTTRGWAVEMSSRPRRLSCAIFSFHRRQWTKSCYVNFIALSQMSNIFKSIAPPLKPLGECRILSLLAGGLRCCHWSSLGVYRRLSQYIGEIEDLPPPLRPPFPTDLVTSAGP